MKRDASLDVLARGLLELHPEEAALALEQAPTEETARMLESLTATRASAVAQRLTPDTASRVLAKMSPAARTPLLEALEAPRAAALLARLDETQREAWLAPLDERVGAELRALGSYPPDSAGGVMDPRVLAVRPETTVDQALTRLRAYRDRKIRRLFLVDGESRLVGSVELQNLATADTDESLEKLNSGVVSVRATASLDEVMEVLNDHQVGTLPVVDFEGRILGVIRHDSLIAAARQVATTDMQTMVGASRDERALSKVSFAVRKRLPWLEVNLGTAFLAAAVVGLFEDTIARNTALAVLLPVVAGQSGNTGSQALAVTMRGLVLREVRTRHWFRVCLKEVQVALLNGVAVALTTAIAVYLWSRSSGLALVIGVSMVIAMAAAGLAGAAIPMILTALRQDPAQSSSIILTTVTDVVGFFSFLGIATMLSSLL